MSWHLGRMAAFDVESTGVNPETARIVTACVVLVGGNQPTQAATWMADPGIDIPTLLDRYVDSVLWPVIDPYVIDKQVDKYRKGSRKLTALCEHYKVRLDGAHDAAADAIAAARVAWRLGSVFPKLAAMDVEALHHAQIEWAAAQAASLQEYFRKKDPAAVVEGAWPLVPFQGVTA